MTYPELLDDLAAETAVLRALLAGATDADWDVPTPSPGWAVRDQVSHLAFFDGTCRQALSEPEEFTRGLADIDADFVERVAEQHATTPPAELLAWFVDERERLLATFRAVDAKQRMPWYGPPMSAMSSATARLMETWAHGVDVHEALGAQVVPSDRLIHVAHIGVRTFGFTYAVRGRTAPETPVRVELAAPDGSVWAWGPSEAADVIRGPAEDFALLITQRRHRDDLALEIVGEAATEWAAIGQAFAGEPGTGREPATQRRS